MTGKVFKNSANIYEDQAKILFDYYKRAAEKIIAEEDDCDRRIKQANEDLAAAEKKRSKYFLITCFTCWTIVGLIVGLVGQKKAKKQIAQATQDIHDTEEQKANIRKDYKVSKMGVAYVPVATRVPFEGKSFLVDHTGGMQNTDFSLSVLHQPQQLRKSLSELEEGLDSVPIVEGNEDAEQIDTSVYSRSVQNVTMHNYMGNIDRQVRNISYLLGDSDTRSVSLPVIPPQSEHDEFINEFATEETGEKPVVKVFNTDGFESKLNSFAKLSELKKELEQVNKESGVDDNNEYFKKLIKKLGESVQLVSQIKTNSTSKLLDYTNSILSAVLKAGYNQYSPVLEAEELQRIRETNFNYEDCVETYKPFELKESSRVKYEIFSRTWIAEDNSRTNMPFGINQIEEEVLMPLINNLMQETRIERLKIYNNIKDQKLSYLNKWHQDVEAAFRDNRKSGQDLITQITNAYAEYTTAHNTYLSYKQTQNAMKVTGSIAASEVAEEDHTDETIKELEEKVEKCKETGDLFQAYINGLQNDINACSERFGFVEYFEATLRDSTSKRMANSLVAENLQNLDSRRQKLIPINSLIASSAELPPLPSVEQKLNEDFTINLNQLALQQLYRIDQEEGAASQDDVAASQEDADASQEDADALQDDANTLQEGDGALNQSPAPEQEDVATSQEDADASQDDADASQEDAVTSQDAADDSTEGDE